MPRENTQDIAQTLPCTQLWCSHSALRVDAHQHTNLASGKAPEHCSARLKAYKLSAAQNVTVGVVGFPNDGKGNLINKLKRAKVRVIVFPSAEYFFLIFGDAYIVVMCQYSTSTVTIPTTVATQDTIFVSPSPATPYSYQSNAEGQQLATQLFNRLLEDKLAQATPAHILELSTWNCR